MVPLANSVFVWILPLVISFGYIPWKNLSVTSWILYVLHSRTAPTTNSLTRLLPSFLQISVEPSSSTNWANLVTVQDSSSHEPSDASQVPNCVSMDSNPGAQDSSQDFKCTELDNHMCQLSRILPQPQAILCTRFVFQMKVKTMMALLVTWQWARILHSLP